MQLEVDLYDGVPNYVTNPFSRLILYIFTRQTSTIAVILGRRGTGKTGKMLLIDEILNKYKEFSKFTAYATNTKIENSPFPIEHITNLDDLRSWAENTKGHKVFGFDEIGKAMRRRTPMGALNIQLLDEFQVLRKYKLSTVATTIDESMVDKQFLGDQMLDGFFSCPVFNNPKIANYVDLLESFDDSFNDIPKTSVAYDTWNSSPFTLHSPNGTPKFSDKDRQVLWDWSNGKTAKDIGLERTQIARITKKFIKEVLERDSNK
jgi:hypothetical protein